MSTLNTAADKGIRQAQRPEDDFLNALRHNTAVFAAFKTHRLQNDVARQLTDSNGNLKPFERWKNDVQDITSHQCKAWLRTEYDTAVLRARQAANWQQFQREKDVLPNLEWMPSTSPNPGADHMPFWGTILPVDHPFWGQHRPGDRWNCKCDLGSTDKSATNVPQDSTAAHDPQPGLDNNPGTNAQLFSDDHPYFPKACNYCDFYKPGIKDQPVHFSNVRKKDCYHCPYINAKLKKIKAADITPPKVDAYKEVYKGKVFTSPYHGENEKEQNERLATFITNKIKSKVYLLPRLDPENPEQKALRSKLLPQGVFENKNPDYLIGGRLFDGKSMYGMRRDASPEQQKNAIENHIKKAKKQADNIILEIPSFVARATIHRTVTNYLSRSKKQRIIMVHWKNKLLIYGQ